MSLKCLVIQTGVSTQVKTVPWFKENATILFICIVFTNGKKTSNNNMLMVLMKLPAPTVEDHGMNQLNKFELD